MNGTQRPPDTMVVFEDLDGVEYRVEIPRQGHTDQEVRTVAYRWACRQIAEGKLQPRGELRYVAIGNLI